MGMEVKKCSTLPGDNDSAIINTQYPSSSIKKKHNSVAFHKEIGAVAAGFVSTGNIYVKQKPSDVMTKLLVPMDIYNVTAPFMYKRKNGNILYGKYRIKNMLYIMVKRLNSKYPKRHHLVSMILLELIDSGGIN